MENRKLTLDEVANILLLADSRQVKAYIEKGLIPKTSVNMDDLTIDAQALAKKLKVEDFTEKFVTSEQAQKILGINQLPTASYCKSKCIPFTILSETGVKGMKILFRPSLLIAWRNKQTILLEENVGWIEDLQRIRILEAFDTTIEQIAKVMGLSDMTLKILDAYMTGTKLSDIAKANGISKERVRQIADKTTRRLWYFMRRVKEWYEVFEKSEESRTTPMELYQSFINAQKSLNEVLVENARLRNEIKNLPKYQQEILLNDTTNLKQINPFLLKDIADLDFSVRTYNCIRYFIKTVQDLIEYSAYDLAKFRNLGKKSLIEIQSLLHKHDLSLKDYKEYAEQFNLPPL